MPLAHLRQLQPQGPKGPWIYQCKIHQNTWCNTNLQRSAAQKGLESVGTGWQGLHTLTSQGCPWVCGPLQLQISTRLSRHHSAAETIGYYGHRLTKLQVLWGYCQLMAIGKASIAEQDAEPKPQRCSHAMPVSCMRGFHSKFGLLTFNLAWYHGASWKIIVHRVLPSHPIPFALLQTSGLNFVVDWSLSVQFALALRQMAGIPRVFKPLSAGFAAWSPLFGSVCCLGSLRCAGRIALTLRPSYRKRDLVTWQCLWIVTCHKNYSAVEHDRPVSQNLSSLSAAERTKDGRTKDGRTKGRKGGVE